MSTVDSTRTTQKRAQLKEMGRQSRRNIFEMLRLADEILRDREYVDELGGEDIVVRQMEGDDFSLFGGRPPLHAMLAAFRTHPREEVWAEHRHDIWAMIKLSRPNKEPGTGERVNWRDRCRELEAIVAEQRAEIERLHKTISGMVEGRR